MAGGMKALVLVFFLGALLVPDSLIVAQVGQTLMQCMLLEDDNVRLECYDRVLGRPVSGAEAEFDPGLISEVGESARKVAEVPVGEEVTEVQVVQEMTAVEIVKSQDRFGLKTLEVALEAVTVVVIRVQKNISGMSVFSTANNQVWIQTSVRSQSYPAAPFEAEIQRSSMNSYFLSPVNGGLSVRVRRER